MRNKEIFIVAIKLFVITAVAALCLAVVNKVTAPVIATNAEKAENEALREVLPAAAEFKKTEFSDADIPKAAKNGVRVENLCIGTDNDGAVSGYVVTAVSNAGYGGDVKVMVGLDNALCVTRAKIMESSETAGLGANASKPAFIDQYSGKSGELSVVKGKTSADDEISAISGATITSRAVTSCVNAATELVKNKQEKGFDVESSAAVSEKVKETEEATNAQLSGAAQEGGGEQ